LKRFLPYGIIVMMDEEELLSELEAWCAAKYGRQRELAKAIGVTSPMVNDWIARRKTPSLRHGLKVLEFLKRRRSKKKG
jgi:predicted XRE-type DNA-binding protein